jgi:hypothetical protein
MNENFPQHLLQKLNRQIQNKTNNTHNRQEENKATTTLQQLTKPTTQNQLSIYENSGIYKIACKTCQKSYVGQTNRNLKLRFQEYTRYIRNNDPRSAYAMQILNCAHEYGNINHTMTLLKPINKPSLLLLYEQMYIQVLHHNNYFVPEQHTYEHNPLFKLLQVTTSRDTTNSAGNQYLSLSDQFSLNQ